MPERTITHGTFTIERTYDAPPARVFAAFADRDSKAQWFAGPDEWKQSNLELDFRVGGIETVSGGPAGGPVHSYRARYYDIVPNERFITAYEMHMDDTRTSVSLATYEFKAAGKGTKLILTENGAFLDGIDNVESREQGTQGLLTQLGDFLAR